MRVRRGLLFWGLFLISVGAVPLLVRTGAIDVATLAGAWRLWPVILIAIGIGLVAGRSEVALVGTVVTAIILGIAAGAALATGGTWFGWLGDCSIGATSNAQFDRSGTFESPATIRIDQDCGNLELSSRAGSDWSLHADYSGSPPIVAASGDQLEIRWPDRGPSRHELWNLTFPSALVSDVDLQANAGSGTVDLSGARLASFIAETNAFDMSVDAGGASIDRIGLTMNAGRSRIILGSGSVTGSLSVNAGAVELCVPAGSQLRIRVTDQLTFASNLDDRGLSKSGGTWTRSGGDPASLIDLSVEGAAASFTLDPDGGCR
jgi:hypothetical protein